MLHLHGRHTGQDGHYTMGSKMSNRQPRFLGIAAGVVLAANSYAADINVPGDQPTIQAGIDAAVDGDEIIVAPGTYFESINFDGKAITVRSTDPDDPDVVAATVIDGTGNFHVVQCVSGEGPDTVLSGFVITGGLAIGGGNDSFGGGMFNLASSPTVMGCTFTGEKPCPGLSRQTASAAGRSEASRSIRLFFEYPPAYR